jgi:putative transposase
VETGRHFLQCLVYIDLNMVRAGIIAHPKEWISCGYPEIQKPRRKCALIAYERLHRLSGFDSYDQFTDAHRKWVASFLEDGDCVRESKWTQGIAIETQEFVESTKQKLGARAKGREVVEAGSGYQLREPQVSYSASFGLENDDIPDTAGREFSRFAGLPAGLLYVGGSQTGGIHRYYEGLKRAPNTEIYPPLADGAKRLY